MHNWLYYFTTYLQPECRQTVKISCLSRFGSAAEGASRVRCSAERQREPACAAADSGTHPAEDGASEAAVEPDRLVDTEQPLRATARLGSVVPRLSAGRRRRLLQMERTRRERALRTHSKDSHLGAGRLSASLPPDRLWAPRRLALLDRTRCQSMLPFLYKCLLFLPFGYIMNPSTLLYNLRHRSLQSQRHWFIFQFEYDSN